MSQNQAEAVEFIEKLYPDTLLLTKRQAAKILNVSVATLDRMVKSGEVPAKKVIGRVLFRRGELAEFIAA